MCEGKRRKLEVKQSKVAKFCCSYFSWDVFLDLKRVREYLDMLKKKRGLHPAGLLTKCDQVETALTLEKTRPSDSERLAERSVTQDRLCAWKTTYRGGQEKGCGNEVFYRD